MRFCVLVVFATLCSSQLAQAETKNDARPNFLVIVADDQSPFDFPIYNPASQLDAPNIARLAAEGMTFDAAYHMGAWAGAVCTPSRHMIMSGRSVWHIPDRGKQSRNPHIDNPEMVPPDLAKHTLAAVFNAAGYETMRTCKIGNSYEGANEQFTIRRDATKRGGTAESGSAWHGQQVLDYLDEREGKQTAKPFLIYFGFSHPHDTRDGTPELLAKYGATNHSDETTLPPAHPRQPQLPINYLPKHPFPDGHPNLRDEVAVSGVWERRDPTTIRNEIGRQFACSENIDIQIGRVLEKLEQMQQLDNTYIIYTADHGMAIGRHGLQGKQNLYEHTWRVPFFVRGPGIAAGSRAPGNLYLMDVLPTLCDLAGISTPETVEGTSFRPVLEGRSTTVRDALYGVYCGGTLPGMRSVRQGDWKLIKYDVLDGKVRETQLFDLSENPQEWIAEHHSPQVRELLNIDPRAEQTNLAEDPAYAEQLRRMEMLLAAEMQRWDDPYPLWDQQ